MKAKSLRLLTGTMGAGSLWDGREPLIIVGRTIVGDESSDDGSWSDWLPPLRMAIAEAAMLSIIGLIRAAILDVAPQADSSSRKSGLPAQQ